MRFGMTKEVLLFCV